MGDIASSSSDSSPDSVEPAPEPVEAALTGEDIRRRAVTGAAIILGRGVSVKIVAFGGNIVLARLLLPEDFGLVAFGLTLMTLASFIGDGGLGAALIRGDDTPTRVELGAVNALQMAAAVSIAVLAALSALPFGSAALVTAVMVASLPIAAMKTPVAIMLERRLSYGPIAVVTIVETISYFAWAVGSVALGAGVWGLATATVVRAICGTTVMLRLSPVGLVLPRWNLAAVRPLLRFGVRYQAAMITGFVRDHGVNVGTAAIAGVAGLGLWSLAGRLMQIPAMLFEALWNVSYPAMARLRDAGEDLAPIIEQTMRLTAVGTGVLLAPLIAAAPALIPSVFGNQWSDVADLIPFLSVALLISGPVSVAATGFLYAAGDAGSVLAALIGNAVVNIAAGLVLLSAFGMVGLAVGVVAGSLTESVMLIRGVRRHVQVRLLAVSGPVVVGAAVLGVVINVVTRAMEPTLIVTACSGAAALALYVLLVATVAPAETRKLVGLARGLWTRRRRLTSDRQSDVARQAA